MTKRFHVNVAALSEKSQRSWAIPEFWEDVTYSCIDCGVERLFRAETQREWYEHQKRYIWERPNRCLNCHTRRKKQRHAKALMDARFEELKTQPDDESTIGDVVVAIVRNHRLSDSGDIQLAIALYRRLPDRLQRQRELRDAIAYCSQHAGG